MGGDVPKMSWVEGLPGWCVNGIRCEAAGTSWVPLLKSPECRADRGRLISEGGLSSAVHSWSSVLPLR